MPWRTELPMDQRLQLVLEFRRGFRTMTELAEDYGVSRKTAYKWVSRFDAAGQAAEALMDRSTRPTTSPAATPEAVIAAVLDVRRRFPAFGAKKVLWFGAIEQPELAWPSRSTVCDILRRHGLVPRKTRQRRAVRAAHTLAPITGVNTTWTTDFKGEFRTGDGRYCYPFTLRDGWSRYVLRCDGLRGTRLPETAACFERAFAEYGLPERIRSDNGVPFAGGGLARLSRLAVRWMRLGIIPERTAPGRPDQNGSHEQFHAVLKRGTTRPPAATLRGQQVRFDEFCTHYNHERPHEALAGRTPAAEYQASWRPLPARLPGITYPGHFEVRRVSATGSFKWRGTHVFVTEVLGGEYIGFEEVDDGLWTLYFTTVAVARFNERTYEFQPLAAITEGREPTKSAPAKKH